MKKALKWIGIILGGLIILVVVAAVGLSVAGASRLNKTHDIQAEAITIPTDGAALARGEHLIDAACKSCHGADLSGESIIDEPPIGSVYAANITGLADTHTDADLVRAIRHGVDTDGRQLMIMPAESFIYFSEEDLGAMVAYLKTVPRAGDDSPEPQLAPVGRILLGAGLFGDVFPAEYIDHDLPFPERPEVGANVAYGQYLARFCTSCHGANLAGGQPGDPASPPAPNLTPGGELAGWTEEDFVTAMRSGVTPSGRQLDPAFMPWESFGNFEDDELRGVWLYLESLPPRQTAAE
ncbi:MAG TPA: c-type cytochrome [Anaerolineae bacterium]